MTPEEYAAGGPTSREVAELKMAIGAARSTLLALELRHAEWSSGSKDVPEWPFWVGRLVAALAMLADAASVVVDVAEERKR